MRNIEQVAARVPFMTSIGNHEDSATNFAHYVERFSNMPSNTGTQTWSTNAGGAPRPNNLYYSWDANLVHYIAISTEFYFNCPKVSRFLSCLVLPCFHLISR